jgi:putative acetyltransferase
MVIDDEQKTDCAEADIISSEERKARILVRPENLKDIQDIYNINSRAFGRNDEGDLVDKLRGEVSPYISLVAEKGSRKTGHILFTPVTIKNSSLKAAGLGPMAVLPDYQGRGIGGALIEEGLCECRAKGMEAVFVLGEGEYYTRYGFEPASDRGLYWRSDEYAPYFFVFELEDGALHEVTGEVRYNPAFDSV